MCLADLNGRGRRWARALRCFSGENQAVQQLASTLPALLLHSGPVASRSVGPPTLALPVFLVQAFSLWGVLARVISPWCLLLKRPEPTQFLAPEHKLWWSWLPYLLMTSGIYFHDTNSWTSLGSLVWSMQYNFLVITITTLYWLHVIGQQYTKRFISISIIRGVLVNSHKKTKTKRQKQKTLQLFKQYCQSSWFNYFPRCQFQAINRINNEGA